MKAVRTLTKDTLFVILVFTGLILSTIPLSFGQGTELRVVAPVGNIPLLTGGQNTQFNVNITVVAIADLWEWQIKLYYNPAVLYWLNATYPPGHIYDGKTFWQVNPVNNSDAGGTYILFAAGLQATDPGFTGSGTLCQIKFRTKAAGTSQLTFSTPLGGDTFLWDSNLQDISATVVDGSVTVVGAETRQPSAISININPTSTVAGTNITISGGINVTVPDGTTYVAIKYRERGISAWNLLANVTTVSNNYSYLWTSQTGTVGGSPWTWEFYAEWAGNANFKPAQSEIKAALVGIPYSWIKVDPKPKLVGSSTAPATIPTSPFNMSIVVQNVTDLYQWQVKISFNRTILEARNVWLPSNNVFGASHTPLQFSINNTLGVVQASMNSSAGGFTGNGILFQIEFRGIATPVHQATYSLGEDHLVFDRFVTQMKNSTGGIIFYQLDDPTTNEIVIFGPAKLTSTISLDFSSSEVKVGTNVTVSGQIAPSGVGRQVAVRIFYRLQNATQWSNVTVQTDSNSKYSYVWKAPNQNGTYVFKASWDGDADYEGATSPLKSLKVTLETPTGGGTDITMYVIIAVVGVIAVVAVVLYMKRFRKPPIPSEQLE